MADITLDSLQIEINSGSEKASKGIDALADSLSNLKSKVKGGVGLTSVRKQIAKLDEVISKLKAPQHKIRQIVQAIEPLEKIKKTNLGNTVNALKKLPEITAHLNKMKDVKFSDGIKELVEGLKPLEGLQKTNLNSTFNTLKKLPEITKGLKDTNMDEFATEIKKAANALEPLANNTNKISQGFQLFPQRIQRIVNQNEKLHSSSNRLSKTYFRLGNAFDFVKLKAVAGLWGISAISRKMSDFMGESNRYVENLNLFNVAMGRYSKEALEYAEAVNKALGVDVSEWIRNQGIFMQIATGFGVVEDKAYAMSKGLNQVSYDLSSFFNIPIEEALEKVQSGISGELEPLRRLGYALDQATLKQIAMENGIKQNINTMTQAQKAQLRYVAIMQQSKNVMGDMARTIMTPANASRILGQQILQLKRAVGNALMPVLIKAIPIIQASVIALTNLMNALAKFLGFKLPKINYSGFSGLKEEIGGVKEEIDNTTGALKKLKDYTLGFDELNIISPQQNTGSGKGITGGAGQDLGIDIKDYDFLGEATGKINEKAKELETIFKGVLLSATGIAGALGGIKIAKSVNDFLEFLKDNPTFKNGLKKSIGFTLAVTGFSLLFDGIKDLASGEGDVVPSAIKSAIGGILGVAGSVLVFGSNPVGWAVSLGLALTVSAIAFKVGQDKKALQEEINARFGDISFTDEEIQKIINKVFPSYVDKLLTVGVSVKNEWKDSNDSLNKDIAELQNKLQKLSIGVDISQTELESSVNSFVSSAKKYLDSSWGSYDFSVKFILGDSEEGTNLYTGLQSIYLNSKEKLNELGEKIKNAVNDGFVNGEWIPDKLKEVQKLQEQMQDILDKYRKLEFNAKIDRIKFDMSEAYKKGDQESVERLKKELQETLDKAKQDVDFQTEIAIQGNYVLEEENIRKGLPTSEVDRIFNVTQAKIIEEAKSKKMEIELAAFNFNEENIKNQFKPEIKKVGDVLDTQFSDMWKELNTSLSPEETLNQIRENGTFKEVGTLIIDDLAYAMKNKIAEKDFSPEVKKLLDDVSSNFKPKQEHLDSLIASGKKIPEEFKTGMIDSAKISALKGELEGIMFMIGYKFSKDPKFIKLIEEIQKAGGDVDKSLISGINLGKEEVGKASEKMGISISDFLEGGIYSREEKLKTFLGGWSKNPIEEFKKTNGISTNGLLMASPWNTSVGFITKGIADGLVKGFNDNRSAIESAFGILKTIAGTVMDGIKDTWSTFVSTLTPPAPSRDERREALRSAAKSKIEKPKYTTENYYDEKARGIRSRQVKLRAGGGFPTTGEMFIARESGPELVGSIGSKSAVANNDQIVAAVSQGVYEAVMKAMSGGNDSQINVYMDGEEISKKIQKGKSGYPVMGGSAFGY